MLFNPPKKKAEGTAHSKIILLGEHSVVYGKPAIALPFTSLKVTATVDTTDSSNLLIDSETFLGTIDEIPKKMRGIAACIKETLKNLGKDEKGLRISLHSSIPIGRGLGSSAALAIAIVRGLYTYFDQKLDRKQLMRLVNIAETYAHGNPSGIDMMAASSEHPVWFQKGKETLPVSIGAPFYLIVADTGRIGDTKSAVDSIKLNYEREPEATRNSINLLEDYTIRARDALNEGNIVLLGELLNLAQIELDKLGVSDEGINNLVNLAQKAGALGVKLTGGGKGGCIIALASNANQVKEISNILLKEGARNTWYVKVAESKKAITSQIQ
ncbi:mevalonate kinase [Caldibacillus lycopersici]|uniref:mevalonate kinase n=1 Tax=Perspicuibacillus lycopersici TaxID=1325689 RepID=A0AAE3IVM0_9BACI|nr:mevalonate kinase [Perspicuibacillus lycopersici]MCU9615047.1 mevalonate kinase [Perspicuibacillus lycopersici]